MTLYIGTSYHILYRGCFGRMVVVFTTICAYHY